MGSDTSKISERKLYEEKEYSLLRASNDIHYGDIKIMINNKSKMIYSELTKTLTSE